jgi:cell surface protein SprA
VKARFHPLSLINAEGEGDYCFEAGRFFVWFRAHHECVETQTLAYSMVIRTGADSFTYIGDLNGGALQHPLRLQMLKHAAPSPSDGLWNAEWKNVYDLRFRNFNYDDLTLEIYAGRCGDEENPANPNSTVNGMPFLRALGLDQQDANGLPIPDGEIDDNPAILDRKAGLLVFPSRRPFADSSVLDEPVPVLYNTADNLVLLEESRYYIKITISARPRIARLGVYNVIEDSEVITLNGRQLHRGVDYYIDYGIGEISFIADGALDPSANVTVCFDYAP